MKKISALLATSAMIIGTFFLPTAAQAKEATLESITCESAVTNITPDDETGDDDGYQVFWFYITVGEDCTMDVSFDENPLMLFVTAGQMTVEDNWTLDTEAMTAQINFTATEIQQVDAEVENNFDDGDTLTQVSFIWQSSDDSGPDERVQGAWVSSDFQEYTLAPPSETSTRMGAEVSGDDGDAGQFSMYMPATAVSSLVGNHDEYDAETFNIEGDMAAYLKNTEQEDATIIETEDGGAFVSFTTEISTEVAESSDNEGGEGQSLSIAGGGPGLSVRATAGPRDSATKPDKPSKNKNKLYKKGKKFAMLNWEDVDTADTYTLHVRKCKNHQGKKCTSSKNFVKKRNYKKFNNLTESQKKVKRLTAGTYYQWRVKSCNDVGCSSFTDWKRFETKGSLE
ncbi:MAG: hypothetical protein COW24_00525 [Candidatus Kerfeldbacteria bacterium CG15_BIG_FIL_POST_REV_8_21_14_020_45_12]|uniref:Fibronectin type-III domain-containing protein n=1 Tax=Candidatus Kerfeldbacteria bacterium CG15_BIG_FIL_POST_REV_8_21_14_020_45_12 TaxID=2014247 RepID=A0A2M7H5A3_9BACT|nr:MAG: hypothetical protein COW24_00525 [Candidatus Kerfeldbacteria bacterium CG15_BIG_FIL_POST_REV_8_21_14_020_45_12]PJA93951.1 MAG: hypothetical protein CO132_00720 [Candidatus Kerfeldbacteria bacterium CG_4_9_14_3_um_filter_45_8]